MQTKGFIYHLLPPEAWEKALLEGRYKPEALQNGGFIHCSTEAHLLESARIHFPQAEELVALRILVKRVKADLVWEEGRNGIPFPHLYAALDFEAVDDTLLVGRQQDGTFNWI